MEYLEKTKELLDLCDDLMNSSIMESLTPDVIRNMSEDEFIMHKKLMKVLDMTKEVSLLWAEKQDRIEEKLINIENLLTSIEQKLDKQ